MGRLVSSFGNILSLCKVPLSKATWGHRALLGAEPEEAYQPSDSVHPFQLDWAGYVRETADHYFTHGSGPGNLLSRR